MDLVEELKKELETLSDGEFERLMFEEYMTEAYDDLYQETADGRERSEWAEDKARDDRFWRPDVEAELTTCGDGVIRRLLGLVERVKDSDLVDAIGGDSRGEFPQ